MLRGIDPQALPPFDYSSPNDNDFHRTCKPSTVSPPTSTRLQHVHPLYSRSSPPNSSPPRRQTYTTPPRRRHRSPLQRKQRDHETPLPAKSLSIALLLRATLSMLHPRRRSAAARTEKMSCSRRIHHHRKAARISPAEEGRREGATTETSVTT